jgi:hypothetical protein
VGENVREKGRERKWKKGEKREWVVKRCNKRKILKNKTKKAHGIKRVGGEKLFPERGGEI